MNIDPEKVLAASKRAANAGDIAGAKRLFQTYEELTSSKKPPEVPPAGDPTKATAPFASAQPSASQSPSSGGPSASPSTTTAGQKPSAPKKEEPGFWESVGSAISDMFSTAAPIRPQASTGEVKVFAERQQAEKIKTEEDAKKKAKADLEKGAVSLTSLPPQTTYRSVEKAREEDTQMQAMRMGLGPVSAETAKRELAAGPKEKAIEGTAPLAEPIPMPLMPPRNKAMEVSSAVDNEIVAKYQSSERVRPRFRPEVVEQAKKSGKWTAVNEADLRQDALNYELGELHQRASVLQGFKDTQAGKEFSQLSSELQNAALRVKDAEAKLPLNDPKYIEINQRADQLYEQLKPVAEQIKPFQIESERLQKEASAIDEMYKMYESGAQINEQEFNERVQKYNQDQERLNAESAPYSNEYNRISSELQSLQKQLGPYAEPYNQYKDAYNRYNSIREKYEPIAKNLEEEQNEIVAGYNYLNKKNSTLESMRLTDPNYVRLQEKKMRVNLEEKAARQGVGAFAELGRALEGKITSAKSAIYDALGQEYEDEGDQGFAKAGMLADNFWWTFVNPYANAGTKFALNTLALGGRMVPGDFLDPFVDQMSYWGDYVDASTPDIQNGPLMQTMGRKQSEYLDMLEDKYGDEWETKASQEELIKYQELAAAPEDEDTVIRMASPRTAIPKLVSTLTTSLAIMSSGGVASGSTRLAGLLTARGAGAAGTIGSSFAGTFEDNYKLALREFGEGQGFFGGPAEKLAFFLSSAEGTVEALNLGPFVPAAKTTMLREAVKLAKNGASKADVFKSIVKNAGTQGATEGFIEEPLTYAAQQKIKTAFNAIEGANLDDRIVFSDMAEAAILGFGAGSITSVANDVNNAIQNTTLYAGAMMYAVNNKKQFTEYVNQNVPEEDKKKVMQVFEQYSNIARSLPGNISMDDKAKLLIPLSQKENLMQSKRNLGLKEGEKNPLSEKIDAQIQKADNTINAILSKGNYGETLEAARGKDKAQREAEAKRMAAASDAIEQKYGVQIRYSPVAGFMVMPEVGVELTRDQYAAAVKEAQKVFGPSVRPAPRPLSNDDLVRRRELVEARDGVPESVKTDDAGNKVKVDAIAARELTSEEKAELDALNQKDELIKQFWSAAQLTTGWRPNVDQARLEELKAKESPTAEETAEIKVLQQKKAEFDERGMMEVVFQQGEAPKEVQKLYDKLAKLDDAVRTTEQPTAKKKAEDKLNKFLSANERVGQIVAKFATAVEKLEKEGKLTRRCP